MTKILVTGATGCSGVGVINYLLSQGYTEVHALVRRTPDIRYDSVSYFEGDITHRKQIDRILEENQYDSVWHLAAAAHPHTKRELFQKINVEGTENVLEAAIKSGVSSFLNASSISVYGKIKETPIIEDHQLKPLGNYAKSKVESENVVKNLSSEVGLKGGIIRLPTILGKEDRHFYPLVSKFINANLFPFIGKSEHELSIIHPYDIGRAFETIMNAKLSKMNSFNASSTDVSLKQLVLGIEVLMKGKNRYKFRLPYPIVYFAGWLVEMFTHIVTPKKDPMFNREYAQIIGKESILDIEKLKDLGYTPIMKKESIFQDLVYPDPVPVPIIKKTKIVN